MMSTHRSSNSRIHDLVIDYGLLSTRTQSKSTNKGTHHGGRGSIDCKATDDGEEKIRREMHGRFVQKKKGDK